MSKIYDEYLRRKKIDKDKLYLFRCGNFYIFIAEDCDYINEYVVLKKVKFTNDIHKCGFPKCALDDYMHVFKNHHLNIEVVEEIKEESIEEWIKHIDIDHITPVDALIKLKELKGLFK